MRADQHANAHLRRARHALKHRDLRAKHQVHAERVSGGLRYRRGLQVVLQPLGVWRGAFVGLGLGHDVERHEDTPTVGGAELW
eukprot:40781-Eustigmatos_ZCMA.PRE.1